jgi:hypothetical protein
MFGFDFFADRYWLRLEFDSQPSRTICTRSYGARLCETTPLFATVTSIITPSPEF